MRNQKGQTLIEVLVALTAFSIIIIPTSQLIMDAINLHVRSRYHLAYFNNGQKVIEDERLRMHTISPGTVPSVTPGTQVVPVSVPPGNVSLNDIQTSITYTDVTIGNLGVLERTDSIDFSNVDDRRYTPHLNLNYSGDALSLLSDSIAMGVEVDAKLTIELNHGNPNILDIRLSRNNPSVDTTVIVPTSTYDGTVDLQLLLTIDSNTTRPINLEIVNNLNNLDKNVNVNIVETGIKEQVLQGNLQQGEITTRKSNLSGDINLFRNVIPKSNANLADSINNKKLYNMDLEIQKLDSSGDYTITTIRSKQKDQ